MSQIDIQAYLETHRYLGSTIEGLAEESLRWKEKPESWSVIEVLTHLLDHNLIVSFRIREILADSVAQLPGFNQDYWVTGQRGNESEAGEILEAFQALLRFNALLFGRLTKEDLEKTGMNHKGVTVRIPEIVAGFIKHVHHHIGQIERVKLAQAQAKQQA